jgi:hypothetical protein
VNPRRIALRISSTSCETPPSVPNLHALGRVTTGNCKTSASPEQLSYTLLCSMIRGSELNTQSSAASDCCLDPAARAGSSKQPSDLGLKLEPMSTNQKGPPRRRSTPAQKREMEYLSELKAEQPFSGTRLRSADGAEYKTSRKKSASA